MAGPEYANERELFDVCLSLQSAEREQMLLGIAETRPALADRLRRLLRAHDVLDGSLPESIGPYRIQRLLGEGGMGVVYEALQVEPVRRRVALKVMRGALNSGQVLARFMAERQALAVMEHPYIAKVLDASETDSGQPYFVMEFVDGRPINDFARDERLSVRDRVRLVAKLCHAVQHAHQKGVIHRDLKPSNVLVERHPEGPVPRVIDFGIAKALAGPLTDLTLVTHAQQAMGTPAYMSPEQAGINAQDIDTRSDVFSIGVILYELLSGALPIDTGDLTFGDFIRRLATETPAPPSSRCTGEALREIRGDLDAVTLKAISRDRTHRYETALAFAQDLERFLEDEPVSARTPAMGYWITGLVRRYRPQLLAASFALAALIAGMVMAVFGLIRAREAERDALQKAEAARAVSEFVLGLFDAADPATNRGSAISVRELVDRGSAQVEDRLREQPAVRAQVLETLSRVYQSLGVYDRAAGLAEASAAASRDNSQLASALVRVGSAKLRLARFDEAEDALRRALALQEETLGPGDQATGRTLLILGSMYWQRDRMDDALQLYRRALSIFESAPEPDAMDLGRALRGVGLVLSEKAEYEEALKSYNLALAQFERSGGPDHPVVADTLDSIGIVYLDLNNPVEARPRFERSFAIRSRVLGPDHPVTAYSYLNIGRLNALEGRLDEAVRHYRRAIDVREQAFGANHPSAADVMGSLARIHIQRGELAAARTLLERARDIYREAYGPAHVDLAIACRGLAVLDVRERKYPDAVRHLGEALAAGQARTVRLDDTVFDPIRSRSDFQDLVRKTSGLK